MDLHVHSCLSPCGDDAMVPGRVVSRALELGLDAVAICDHNTTGNVAAFRTVGSRQGLAVLGGMEITSREEIHVLAILDDPAAVERLEERVAGHLSGENRPEAFGDQIVVDPDGRAVDLDGRLLIGATDLPLSDVVDLIHGLGGLAVAAHVDRPVFSVLSQLGFIPGELDLDAVELSPHYNPRLPVEVRGLPRVTFSDAHFPEEIGRSFTRFRVATASVGELHQALQGRNGRAVRALVGNAWH